MKKTYGYWSFWDLNTAVVFPLASFLQAFKNLRVLFLNFVNISPIANLWDSFRSSHCITGLFLDSYCFVFYAGLGNKQGKDS